MYGKHFESMYEGSMYGAGLEVFAVWGYVIAHTKASRVELNPRRLADTLGGEVKTIEETIKFLMSPDANSRHKEHEGRRLLKEGEFQYFVPSWEAYQAIKNAEERRIYNCVKKRESRAKQPTPVGTTSSHEPPEKTSRFKAPTIEECTARAEEMGMSCDQGERFFNYHGSKGWKIGKSPMKNWHMAMANWLKNGIEKGTIIIQEPPATAPKKRTKPIFQVPGLNNEWTLDRGPARSEFKEGYFGDCQMSEYSAMYEWWKKDYLKAIGNRATPANGA